MATKTLTITEDAYKRLKSNKQNGESFSETVLRVVPEVQDVDAWLADIKKMGPFSKEFFEAVEDQIKSRRHPINRGMRRKR